MIKHWKAILTLIFLAAIGILILRGCNSWSKKYGGNTTVRLEPNQRLLDCSWKDNNLWILTEMGSTNPKTYIYREHSNVGIVEGQVTIIEQ